MVSLVCCWKALNSDVDTGMNTDIDKNIDTDIGTDIDMDINMAMVMEVQHGHGDLNCSSICPYLVLIHENT
jgi:hypothetical protein